MLKVDTENHYGASQLDGSDMDFKQLFISSAIGMALLDTKGRFLSANAALCDILGHSEEELRKMRCEELLDPFGQGKSAGLLRSFDKAHATSWKTERTILRKDGSLLPVRIWISLMNRPPYKDPRSLVMIEDISEQKDAEEELNRRTDEVEMLASQLIQSQEEERKRLARELHDDIGQRLSLVASEVALMASQNSDAATIAADRLGHLRDDLDGLCSDIHCISHDLHSYKLQHLGLKSALKDLCRRMSQPGFQIDLDVDDIDEPASKDVSLCLYRVVQEALNNALRHAHTLVVAVTLAKVQNMIYMTIQDAGIGFDRSAGRSGLGLISMSERLKLVNGDLKLHSILGRGTEIWVSVPDERKNISSYSRDQVSLDVGNPVSCFEVA